MRVFNRLLMALIFAGLTALGVFGVLYAFDLFGFSLTSLLQTVDLPGLVSGLQGFVGSVEGGSFAAATVAILVVVAIVGLVLLLAELKPRRPRKIKLQDGVYITRGALEDELVTEARQTQEVLTASAKAKARRRPGAKVKFRAGVRHGEDTSGVRSKLQESLRGRLQERGVPKSKLKIAVDQVQAPSKGGSSQGRRVR